VGKRIDYRAMKRLADLGERRENWPPKIREDQLYNRRKWFIVTALCLCQENGREKRRHSFTSLPGRKGEGRERAEEKLIGVLVS